MTRKRFLKDFYGKTPLFHQVSKLQKLPKKLRILPQFCPILEAPPKIYNLTIIMPKVWKFPMTANPPPKSSKMQTKHFKIHPKILRILPQFCPKINLRNPCQKFVCHIIACHAACHMTQTMTRTGVTHYVCSKML